MAGAGAGLWALAGVVSAQPSDYELDWQAPAGCPTTVEVRGWVSELLGNAPVSGPLQARGVVRSEGDSYVLSLDLGQAGAQRRRELGHESCEELSRAGALVIAIALAPEGLSESAIARFPDLAEVTVPSEEGTAEQPSPAQPWLPAAGPAEPAGPVMPQPPPPQTERASTPNEPAAPADRPESLPSGFVTVAALGNLGVLPRFSPGLGLGAGAYLDSERSFLLGAELGAYAPVSEPASGQDRVGGDFWLFAATGTFCHALVRSDPWPAYLSACAMGELYAMAGKGRGGSWDKTSLGYWFAPGAAVEVGFTQRAVQVGLRVGGLVSIRPPEYVMDNVNDPVHEPGRWVLTAALIAHWSIL